MSEQWNQKGPNLTIRLGQLALRAQALVIRQRLHSIKRMALAQARDVTKYPGGAQQLEELEHQLNLALSHIEDASRG